MHYKIFIDPLVSKWEGHMGHERVGILPRSQAWRNIVALIGKTAASEINLSEIANATLNQVRKRFEFLQKDKGIKAAFKFLISISSTPQESSSPSESYPHLDLRKNPSSFELSFLAKEWIESNTGSKEYSAIAGKSVVDTITQWTLQQSQQTKLFSEDDNAKDIWGKAGTGAGFCEVSRIFFSKYTERYLKYFLEREASTVLNTIQDRQNFSDSLAEHIDAISKHAFETSKITQSFAAGWYNKYAKVNLPKDGEVEGFLKLAFGKIREELWREGNS